MSPGDGDPLAGGRRPPDTGARAATGRSLPPTRVLVAAAVTVVALGIVALSGLHNEDGPDASDTTSSTVAAPTVAASPAPDPAVTTSIVIRPDWYPKASSRYSEREPAVTITTVSTTSTTSTTLPDGAG